LLESSFSLPRLERGERATRRAEILTESRNGLNLARHSMLEDRRDYPRRMICPACQGPRTTVITGKRPLRRELVCPKCDSPADPMMSAENQGWVAARDLKPPT
jgi:hypothetical protein